MVSVDIDGSEVLKLLNDAPGKAVKAIRATYRKAGTTAAKAIRSATEPRFKSLVTSKVGKLANGDISVAFGYFKGKGHVKEGSDVDDWFKKYWKDYGTLENRDPSHRFTKPRKAVSRKWRGGIQPAREFESVKPTAQKVFIKAIEEEFPKQFDKEFDK